MFNRLKSFKTLLMILKQNVQVCDATKLIRLLKTGNKMFQNSFDS